MMINKILTRSGRLSAKHEWRSLHSPLKGFWIRCGFRLTHHRSSTTLADHPERAKRVEGGERDQLLGFQETSAGFTLIEVLISSAIASMIVAALIFAFSQSNKLIPALDSYDDVYTQAAILNVQLERDFSGAFAPQEYFEREKKKKKEPEQKEQQEKQKKEQAEKAKKAAEEKKEAEKEVKPLEKLFYGIDKDGLFDYMTFITNNPLTVYWSEKTGSARPRVMRVVYRLQEDKEAKKNKKTYKLVRQESPDLEYKAFEKGAEQKIKEQVIADNIKDLSVTYTVFKAPDEEEKAEKGMPEKKEKKEFKQWTGKKGSEAKEKTDEKEDTLPLLPQLLQVKVTFWDYQQKRTFPFNFTVYNYSEVKAQKKSEPSKLVLFIKEKTDKVFQDAGLAQKPNTQTGGKR